MARFRDAIARELPPIVVDRGNGLNPETREYALAAVQHGYQVTLAEPDSPWWLELRVLLKYKHYLDDALFDAWAKRLADATRDTHRVPAATIRRWMSRWRHDLTVQEILDYEIGPSVDGRAFQLQLPDGRINGRIKRRIKKGGSRQSESPRQRRRQSVCKWTSCRTTAFQGRRVRRRRRPRKAVVPGL